MAEQDSNTKSKLEEIAERAGVDIRVLHKLMGKPDDPFSLAKRKLSHLRVLGDLLEDTSWVSEGFTFGEENMSALAGMISDMTNEALVYLAEFEVALEELPAGPPQAEPGGGEA